MPPELEATFAALADPARLEIVAQLRREPQRPSELADALSLSRPALSRHLRILREAGLVSESLLEDDARARLYELDPDRFRDAQAWLDDVMAFWDDQLQAFKAHAERR